MKTRLAILALALMAGMSAAAVTPVWTAPKTLGKTIHPYGTWYTFTDAEASPFMLRELLPRWSRMRKIPRRQVSVSDGARRRTASRT